MELFSFSQPQFMDSIHNQLNFYDFADNPAALYEDEKYKMLVMGFTNKHTSGDYHLPFSPETINNKNFFVRNIYPLTEDDLFKGYFGYINQIDHDVLWSHQSRLLESNYFVIGDSSTGDFELNGIYLSGEWSHRFSQDWLAGVGFYYNVDQRLKQVFPKPLNKHRDIYFKSGIQYNQDKWNIGLTYHYSDEQEKVEISKYNLDQHLTPTILKFRFTDLPVVLRGETSEERNIENTGHKFGIQFSTRIKNLIFLSHFDYGFYNGEVIDGGSERNYQGNYNIENISGKVRLIYENKFWKGFISYRHYFNKDNSYHPDFDYMVIKNELLDQKLVTGAKISISAKTNLYTDLYYNHFTNSLKDLMTENLWYFKRDYFGSSIGVNYFLNINWEGNLWINANFYNNYDIERTNKIYSNFSEILYTKRLEYYISNKMDRALGLQIVYHYLPFFDVELIAQYLEKTTGSNYYNKQMRNTYMFSLWTKLFIY